MNEKEILQKIKEDAESLTPPPSLSPEAIDRMLREHTAAQEAPEAAHMVTEENPGITRTSTEGIPETTHTATKEGTETAYTEQNPRVSSITEKHRRSRRIAQFGSIAAVFALAILACTQSGLGLRRSGQKDTTQAVTEQEDAVLQAEAEQANTVLQAEAGAGVAAQVTADADAGVPEADVESSSYAPVREALTYADSYEEIYRALYEQFGRNNLYRGLYSPQDSVDGMAMGEEMAIEKGMGIAMDYDMTSDSTAAQSAAGDTGADADFSQTNVQEAGVDEADIVKTDGEYIYILRQDAALAIVRADGADTEVVSLTKLDAAGADSLSVHEMYVDGDTLSVIVSAYTSSLESDGDVYYTDCAEQTMILTYDISDRSEPVPAGAVAQDGYYEDSRKNGSFLYLFTWYNPTVAETYDQSVIVPRVNGVQLPAHDFYLPESLQDSSCLVISSVDTANPAQTLDSKVLVSGASHYYVSAENIYIANEHYGNVSGSVTTELVKFHYEDGMITGVAAGTVPGYLNNSFSLNEYQGMLRVVSTYYGEDTDSLTSAFAGGNQTEHNGLFILDESLRTVGSVKNLAEDETIRSARFFGDTGYFVTFRQTDPLFSVDLSDPANPRILGELKLSGFSSYLHFYGEDLLLGIGYEADEETGIISGLKLSMFDISDPANLKELHRFVLPGITWCPAIEDYKAILVSPEKNLFGFFCDDRYMVFSYDPENGFTRELLYDFYSDILSGQAQYYSMRGLYIGETFYLVGDTFVVSFDMAHSFEKESVIPIGAPASGAGAMAETGGVAEAGAVVETGDVTETGAVAETGGVTETADATETGAGAETVAETDTETAEK